VLPDQSQHMVMTVAADGKVAPKQVDVGDIRDGLRVIRLGLAPNDRVIVGGSCTRRPEPKSQLKTARSILPAVRTRSEQKTCV
jgi:membrane fusion protein, multidrug efflux system